MSTNRRNEIRIAVVDTGPTTDLDSAAKLVAGNHALDLGIELFDPSTSDLGTLMDLLEVLPKSGVDAVDLRDPIGQELTSLAKWTASAEQAGLVDSITFPESDTRLPDGHNVSYLATQRTLTEDLDVRGRSVVLSALPVLALGA